MTEKILYVYAKPKDGNLGENTNVVEVVDKEGRIIRTEVGLNDGLIEYRVLEAWVQNYSDIRFNLRPDGKESSTKLDTGLLAKLYGAMPTITLSLY